MRGGAPLLFEVLKNLFAYYVANFDAYTVLYGSLGGILLFMTSTYLSSVALIFGAEIAATMPRLARPPRGLSAPGGRP